MKAMDCLGNDGSVEEFYLVLLDGRLEYSVRVCRREAFRFSCIYAAIEEFKCTLYFVDKITQHDVLSELKEFFSWQKAELGLNNLIENTSLSFLFLMV